MNGFWKLDMCNLNTFISHLCTEALFLNLEIFLELTVFGLYYNVLDLLYSQKVFIKLLYYSLLSHGN